MQTIISFAIVERFAIDMFVDTASVTPGDDQVAASAAADSSQDAEDGAGAAKQKHSFAQRIEDPNPGAQGYEIPIAIHDVDTCGGIFSTKQGSFLTTLGSFELLRAKK